MAGVLQLAFFNAYGIPFEITVFVTLILIWSYTCRSGIKTIVYTDIFQTIFLLLAVALSIHIILQELDIAWKGFSNLVSHHPSADIFVWEWGSKSNFFKLFLTGAFLTIVTNGLDQSVMQKHLTCPNLRAAQKNMFWFSVMLLAANALILVLGLLLIVFAAQQGIEIPANTDDLYPLLAVKHFSVLVGIFFLLGISAAAYSSADSAITGLTTSICVDFLQLHKNEETDSKSLRFAVHFGVAIFLYVLIIGFKAVNNQSVIKAFIQYSGYTYGPLLGLFLFGLFTRYRVKDSWVPFICLMSPVLSYILYRNSEAWFWGYEFGFEILVVNAAITCVALWLTSWRPMTEHNAL